MTIKYNIGKRTKATTENVSISGCSCVIHEIEKSTGHYTESNFCRVGKHTSTTALIKHLASHELNYKLYGVICPEANISKRMYTGALNKDARKFLLIDKTQKHPRGVVWTSKMNLVIDDPFNQVPHWCLRPEELINIKALTQGGLFSKVSYPDDSPSRHTGYRDGRTKLLRKRFKNNTTRITSYASGTRLGSFTFSPGTNVYDLTVPAVSEQHISDNEWKSIFHNMEYNWFASSYFGGLNIYPPEKLVEDALNHIVNAEFDIGMIGGNWKCNSSHDTIRIMCAISEQLGWDSGTSKKHPYLEYNGQKVYFKWVPFVYESPLHRDHPVSAMVYSRTPIHWEEMS